MRPLSDIELGIYDTLPIIIILTRVEDQNIVYINGHGRKIYGDIKDKNYNEVVNSNSFQSSRYHNEMIEPSSQIKFAERAFQNTQNNRWYSNQSQLFIYNNENHRLDISTDITERKFDERALMKLINHQRIFVDISLILANKELFDIKINKIIRLVNDHFNLNGAQVVDQTENIIYSTNTEYISSIGLFNKTLNTDGFTDFIQKHKIISSESIESMDSHYKRGLKTINDASKFVVLPMIFENAVTGLLCLFKKNGDQNWHYAEIELFQSIAKLLASSINQNKAEIALQQSEKQLRIANNTKNKFLKIIAHDLKNPFTTIMGFSELLLRRRDLPEKRKEIFIENIQKTSKLSYALLENLFLWAKSQDGTLSCKFEKIFLNEVIDENIGLLQTNADKKRVKIISKLNKDHYIMADKMMLNTVLRNLITNAIKYSFQNTEIVIKTSLINGALSVCIEDFGMGMTQDDINKLFRMDSNYSIPGTENEQGTGLGLMICKEFIDKQQGKIWVESKFGEGSRFFFTVLEE